MSGSLGTNHTFALAGRASYAGLGLRYVGERNAGFDTAGTSQPNFRMPSYVLADLQGGVDFGTFQLALFVRNLSDRRAVLGADGSRLPNSARQSGSLGTNHTFALAGLASYAGLSLRYVGERNAGFDTAGTSQPNFKMPSYTLIDLQGGVDFGAFQLALFVRNLSDQRAILAADAALVAFGSPLRATVAQPRTFGATLTASF